MVPQVVEGLYGERCTMVACGGWHTAAVTGIYFIVYFECDVYCVFDSTDLY